MGSLGYRYCPEREVEMVFPFGFVSALAVGQPGKLFGIAEDELDLETQGVSLQSPGTVFFGASTEIQFVALNRSVISEILHRDKFDNAFEALDPHLA